MFTLSLIVAGNRHWKDSEFSAQTCICWGGSKEPCGQVEKACAREIYRQVSDILRIHIIAVELLK